MGGAKVADNYGDFYDGSWDSEMSSGRAGIPSSSTYILWTGSENQGTRASTLAASTKRLGSTSVRIGRLNGTGEPLSSSNGAPGTNLHYYALSNIFVVPNSEATGQPAVTGTPRVNETLTADTSGITDPEGTGQRRIHLPVDTRRRQRRNRHRRRHPRHLPAQGRRRRQEAQGQDLLHRQPGL